MWLLLRVNKLVRENGDGLVLKTFIPQMDIPFKDLNGSNVINTSGTFSCLGHIWKIKMVWCNIIYHLREIWCSLLKVIVDCCTSMWQTRWHLIPLNATFLKVHHLQTYKSTIYWIGSLIIRKTLSHACNIYVTHDILGFLLIRHLDSSLFLRYTCEHPMSQHVFTGKLLRENETKLAWIQLNIVLVFAGWTELLLV